MRQTQRDRCECQMSSLVPVTRSLIPPAPLRALRGDPLIYDGAPAGPRGRLSSGLSDRLFFFVCFISFLNFDAAEDFDVCTSGRTLKRLKNRPSWSVGNPLGPVSALTFSFREVCFWCFSVESPFVKSALIMNLKCFVTFGIF